MNSRPAFGEGPAVHRSDFSHYLPRLRREFYRGDAVVFWTLPVARHETGWLGAGFHAAFREHLLHAAAREGLLCPAYCLMPDHLHLVWMGLRATTDQRDAMRFLRAELGRVLRPCRFQHQAHDHVLTPAERRRQAFTLACADYVLLNPWKRGLAARPEDWPHAGAVIPGYPRANPWAADYWPWLWQRLAELREPGLEQRVMPPRAME